MIVRPLRPIFDLEGGGIEGRSSTALHLFGLLVTGVEMFRTNYL